jgi:hypothetical protein
MLSLDDMKLRLLTWIEMAGSAGIRAFCNSISWGWALSKMHFSLPVKLNKLLKPIHFKNQININLTKTTNLLKIKAQ